MDASSLASIAGVIVTLGAVIRWLLQVWAKQAKEIESLRTNLIDGSISRLDRVVGDHKTSLNTLDYDIKNLKTEITKLLGSNSDMKKTWTEMSDKLDRYIEDNQKRFVIIDGEVRRISDDLIMVKGKLVERRK